MSDEGPHTGYYGEQQQPTTGLTPPDLPDSGRRQEFGEGNAIREDDSGKPAMRGISPWVELRLAMVFTKGGKKYGDFRNWEKGMPMTRCYDSARRHLAAWMQGDESEDHLGAALWNIHAMMHYEEVGRTDLDDRPDWGRRDAGS